MRFTSASTCHAGRPRAFTLIELLVVIAIIALLVSILMPSLSQAKRLARRAVCQSTMRGYGSASLMYTVDNDGVMMDSLKHLDADVGIPAYWGDERKMPQDVARCPDDGTTEQLGRLGTFDQYGDDLKVSIGCNENMLSCSARMTRNGPVAFWVPIERISGRSQDLMVWADWQEHPYFGSLDYAVVKPYGPSSGSTNPEAMGGLCFRHPGGATEAVFLDGHVGEMRIALNTIDEGHELADGVEWSVNTIGKFYKCYYPFGVGATQTSGDQYSYGMWPDFDF